MSNSTAKNLSIMGSVKIVTILANVITSIFLARLLFPYDFGVVTTIMIVINLTSNLNDFGLFSAGVQIKKLTDKRLYSLFTLRFAISVSMFLLVFILSPWIAKLLGIPKLFMLIQILSFQFIFAAWNYIPNIMLTRKLKFNIIGIIQIIGSLLYSIVAVSLAFMHLGYYSIIFGMLVSSVGISIGYSAFYKWNFRLSFYFSDIVKQLKFAVYTFVSNLLWYFSTLSITLSILVFVGIIELGYYNVASTWALFATSVIAPILHSVLFPTYSKHQDNHKKINDSFYQVMKLVAYAVVPAMVGLMAVSYPFIVVVLSGGTNKWLPILVLFRVLVIYSIMQIFVNPLNTVILSIGRADIITKINLITFALFSTVMPVMAMHYGLEGIEIGIISVFSVVFVLYYYYEEKLLGISPIDIIKWIYKPILFSFAMGITVYYASLVLHPSYTSLAFEVGLGILIYFSLAYMFEKEIIKEYMDIFLEHTYLKNVI
jgi:O-antigen/teichoic acid export membrane protein